MANESQKKEQEMDAMWGEQSKDSGPTDKCAWFQHDRYSMFIHWGLYSLLAGEWKNKTYYGIGEWIMHEALAGIPVDEYKILASKFNPTNFSAKNIVALAKDAGMKCIVITAKHHEGFALFDSPCSEFSITKATPYAKDVMKDLAQECQKEGIRFGFYYSQYQDWIESDGGSSKCEMPDGYQPDFDRYFYGKVVPQVKELLTNYGPISIVWFDTPGRMSKAHSQELVDLVHDLQPECLVNSRVGNGLGDYSTMGDMEIPTMTVENRVVECVDTTNNSWSYAYYDSDWKSPTNIVQNLIRTIARNSNYMLNVGPDGMGDIPQPAVHALKQSGAWIKKYQEAIYGCSPSPFPPFSWGDCTTKGHDLYLHIFKWPKSGTIILGGIKGVIQNAEILNGEKLDFQQESETLMLNLPNEKMSSIASVIKMTLDTKPHEFHQYMMIDGEYQTDLLPEYASLEHVELKHVGWMETFGEWKASKNLTNWFSNSSAQAVWQINVLKEGRYTVSVEYACPIESEGSEWEIKVGDERVLFPALSTNQEAGPGGRVRMRYCEARQGMLELTGAGCHSLTLSPKEGSKSGDIWIRKVTLTPWY